jgi:hypothetical protein
MLAATAPAGVLLEARYRQVAGSNPEYAQGAVEKNDLPHREVRPMVWVILVDEPGDPDEWRQRLDAVTDPKHGSWSVGKATPEEIEGVRSGTITLQK